jgi:hypothetical protein
MAAMATLRTGPWRDCAFFGGKYGFFDRKNGIFEAIYGVFDKKMVFLRGFTI